MTVFGLPRGPMLARHPKATTTGVKGPIPRDGVDHEKRQQRTKLAETGVTVTRTTVREVGRD